MLSCRRRARELRRGSASTGSGSHVRMLRSAASSSCAPESLSACARVGEESTISHRDIRMSLVQPLIERRL